MTAIFVVIIIQKYFLNFYCVTKIIVDNGYAILNKIDKVSTLRGTKLQSSHISYLLTNLHCKLYYCSLIRRCFSPLWAFSYALPVSENILSKSSLTCLTFHPSDLNLKCHFQDVSN